MAHIHLCRHGQDLDNKNGLLNGHRDTVLSELGEQQARQVADTIKQSGVPYAAIYSSPLRRANETARFIGEAIELPVRVLDDLIERNFGVLTGKPLSSIRAYAGDDVFEGDKVLYFLKVDGAETFDRVYTRAQKVLQLVHERHAGEHVLLVCHGDIGKMIQAAQQGVDYMTGLRLPYFANTAVIDL